MQPIKLPMNRRAIPAEALESVWHAADGWPIRRIDWKSAKASRGSMLFLAGRGDHYEKYLETLTHFAASGWCVTSTDWRGQGGSGRLLCDPEVGHIDDFSTWISDLKQFWHEWKATTPGPHVILAHSMGGHLAMRALVERAIDPEAVVMSAPMLGIRTGSLPLCVNHAFARLMCKTGRADLPAWKASEKPLSPMNQRAKILTGDKDRYEDELAWWKLRPEVKLGPPSWQWIERAIASIQRLDQPGLLEAVTTPILLMATTSDQLVSTARIIKDSKRLPNAETLVFGKEAAHELLRETDAVRDRCLERIADFVNRYAPVK
jgi:lysophospholipase